MLFLLTFLFGVVTGVAMVGAGVWYVLSFFFLQGQEISDNVKKEEPTAATFQLPHALVSKISDESCKSKESCWALNFVLYFLFRELRNSEGIRRWVLRKLSLEFEELLATTVLGKFFSNIVIQNIDLGQNFPVLSWLKTSKIELHPMFENISTLDILVDLEYAGGFQFSIQAETHLKRSAYLSVQFKAVKGQARLQFATEPYAHWSFGFAENPDIDISVVSQLYGKSFGHITNIIASQLKRSVRKKHTLPMYKIRYKPFFARVEHIIAALVPNSAPQAEVKGALTVKIIEFHGLMNSLLAGNLYSILGLGEVDWVAAYMDKDGSISIVRDLVYVKPAKRETNLDFTLGMMENVPVVESVLPQASTKLEFEKGDEILMVDGKKVASAKQCIKNFKNSSSMKVVWRIRRKHYCVTLPPLEEHSTELPGPSNTASNASNSGAQVTAPDVATDNHTSSTQHDNDQPNLLVSSQTNGNTSRDRSRSPSPSSSRRSSVMSDVTSVVDSGIRTLEDGSTALEIKQERSYGFRNSLHDNRLYTVVRTADVPCSRDPIISESFKLKVDEGHRFLNLAIWSAKAGLELSSDSPSSSPSKRIKVSSGAFDLITFNDDRLIGTISIPISDIIAECGTTGMGYFVKDYYLRSPDGNATEARDNPLVAHSGFEPHLCYGKVSISFLFKPDEDSFKRRDSAESSPNIPIEIATDALLEPNISSTDEFQSHQLVRTNFRVATICDYCNKKIWLKDAFACRICHMKCHKKCNDRCMANTICRGEGYYPSLTSHPIPPIITTDEPSIDDTLSEGGSTPNLSIHNVQSGSSASDTNGVRRRTFGGLLISAVQNRSAQLNLRRVGSATNLLSPNQNQKASSKSLPPSPQVSPTTHRKATAVGSLHEEANPFQILGAGGFGSSEEDIQSAVEHIIQNPNDDLVAMAKESGRDVYSQLPLSERKQKLNHVLNRIQEEIDVVSTKRMELCRAEMNASPGAKAAMSKQIEQYEERTQALALLMLYYCSGLQRAEDLEETEKDEQLVDISKPETESMDKSPTA